MNRPNSHVIVLVVGMLAAVPAFGQTAGSDEWQYRVTPYLWLPTIGGDLRYEAPPGGGTGSPTVDVGPVDWLELLNYGLLIGGSARKGRLGLFADLVYLSMSSEKDDRIVSVEDTITIPGSRITIPVEAALNADTRTDLDGLLFNMAAGYVFRQAESSTAIVFAGARYFDVRASTTWDLTAEITGPGDGVILPSSGTISGDTRLWDAIVGVRGEFGIGSGKWSVPWYFDYGRGDSDKTWNVFAGVVRAFSWGDLLLAYRHLEYDQGEDKLLQDFSFGGPLVGVSLSF